MSFGPTLLKDAFQQTVQFYDQAYAKFPSERKAIEKCVRKDLLKDCDEIMFKNFIEQKKNQINLE